MRVLLVNRALGTLVGGGESFDLNAARYLVRQGHAVTIVTGRPLVKAAALPAEPGVPIIGLRVPNLRHYAYVTAPMNRLVSAAFYHVDQWVFERRVLAWLAAGGRIHQYDLVQHCELFHLPAWILHRWHVPVVSWLPGPQSGLARRALRRLIGCPGFGLFTRGHPAAWLASQGFVEGRDFAVVEPGVELARVDAASADRDAVRRELGLSGRDVLGITVSRLVPVKNPALLVRGLALAVQAGVSVRWLVIGAGPQRAGLEREAKRLGVSNHIRFLGYRPAHEVHRFLAAGDCFALTSDYENFSIASLEAMAHRLPLIATDVGYLGTLVRQSGAGLLVPRGDAQQLAQAIRDLSQQADLRRDLGQRGRVFVERFDWPRIADKLAAFYEQLQQPVQAGAALQPDHAVS